jgi:type IV pilus assembly protein PilM
MKKLALPSFDAFPAKRGAEPRWGNRVGVDLSETSVKLVRLRAAAGSGSVSAAAAPLAEEPGSRREDPAARVRRLVEESGFKGAPAAIAIGGNDVVIRQLTLPALKRADILPALRLECRKHVTGPIEESEIRYEVLARTKDSMDLLVTVAPRRKVAEARALLERAGLKPACVTSRPAALLALIAAAGAEHPEDAVAYLDIGAAESHVTVIKGREVRFARELGVGGESFTDALRSIVVPGQGTISLSPEEAEALKRAHGIPIGPEEASSEGRIPLAAVSVMLRPVLERLVRELWNSFDYVNEQFLGESVARVVLMGEGARVQHLSEYLAGVLKIPVSRTDLSERAASRLEAGRVPACASDLGLALSLLGEDGINFLAPPEAGIADRLARAVPAKAAAAVAALLLLSVSLPAEVAVMRERQRVGTLRARLESVRSRVEELGRFRAARAEESRLKETLERLAGGHVAWSRALEELAQRMGGDARLTTLEVVAEPGPAAGAAVPAGESGREVRLSGLLDTQRARPEEALGALMESLARSRAFTRIRLEECRTLTPALSSFTLTARVVE